MPKEFFRFGPGALLKLMLLDKADDGGTGGSSTQTSDGGTGGSQTQVSTDPAKSGEGADSDDSFLATLPPQTRKELLDLRREVNDKRIENKRLKDEEQKRQAEASKAEQAKLEADKQWETLAGKHKATIDELTPKAEQADRLLALITSQNTARIEKLPKEMQSLVPTNYDPVALSEWLEANAAVLAKPKVPNLDAGSGGDKGDGKGKVEYKRTGW